MGYAWLFQSYHEVVGHVSEANRSFIRYKASNKYLRCAFRRSKYNENRSFIETPNNDSKVLCKSA